MQWFKHYHNASSSNKISKIEAEFGLEGYARYFKLLELIAEKFDGERENFEFPTKTLTLYLGFYHVSRMRHYLQCLSNVGLMSFECQKTLTSISTPIMLKLQSKDFKYDRDKRESNDPKIKIKNKSKKEGNLISKNTFGKTPGAMHKSDQFISMWNELCGSKDKAALIQNSDIHQKIHDAFLEVPDLDDWRILITFGVKHDFWRKRVSFRWLINPTSSESLHNILNEAKDSQPKKKAKEIWL